MKHVLQSAVGLIREATPAGRKPHGVVAVVLSGPTKLFVQTFGLSVSLTACPQVGGEHSAGPLRERSANHEVDCSRFATLEPSCSPDSQLGFRSKTAQRRIGSDVLIVSRCSLNAQLGSQRRRRESNPLETALQAVAVPSGSSVKLWKRPRQESNLVYELRKLAC